MDKEEFARKLVDDMEMDTLIDTAVDSIIKFWEKNPELFKEEVLINSDFFNNNEELNTFIENEIGDTNE